MSHRAIVGTTSLIVLVAVGVVVAVAQARAEGQERLREVLGRHASQGYGDSLSDLVASAPPADAGRQNRAWAWMQERGRGPLSFSLALDEAWYFARDPQPPLEEREWFERLRPVMEDLRAILDDGPVWFTSLGWIRQDEERLASTRISERQPRLPNLLRVREAHRWFALEAMTAADPTPALDALDDLGSALNRPGNLIEAMIAGASASMRDRAIARLAVRGDLPPERLKRWLAETPRSLSWLADAWRGERLSWWAPLGQSLLAGAGLSDHFDDPGGLGARINAALDCAVFLEFLAANEAHLRGDGDAADVRRAIQQVEGLGGPYEMGMACPTSMFSTGLAWRTEHRLVRLGVRIAIASRERDRAPLDEDEARQWLGDHVADMASGGWDVALRYERLDEERYRLAVDPKSPLPEILRDTNEGSRTLRSDLGKPASERTLRVGSDAFELQLVSPLPEAN